MWCVFAVRHSIQLRPHEHVINAGRVSEVNVSVHPCSHHFCTGKTPRNEANSGFRSDRQLGSRFAEYVERAHSPSLKHTSQCSSICILLVWVLRADVRGKFEFDPSIRTQEEGDSTLCASVSYLLPKRRFFVSQWHATQGRTLLSLLAACTSH